MLGRAAAMVFGGVTALRNALYDRALMRIERAPLPVVSVGNLVAGGSGKTPLVIAIAARLRAWGVPCAVLARGYGRHRRSPLYLEPGAPLPSWRAVGDEPWLVRRRLPDVALGVDGRRLRAARALAPRLARGIFVLDDGFQHRRLHRDLEIVTLNALDPLGGGRLLPAGRLRESPSSMARADLVVVTGDSAARREQARRLVRAHAPHAALVEVELKLCGWRAAGSAQLVAQTAPPGAPALVVSGIAMPDRFVSSLARFAPELEVREHLVFGDHHRFRRRDCAQVLACAQRVGASCIVSTEKDEPRLLDVWSAELPLWIAVADLEVLSGSADLDEALGRVAAIGAT